ncbi:MAG: hypothetical protein M1819_004558 [Sarea resinae]|nr:MAG: hypothetical protein M1819_004558 [Sarea resinae]
MWVAGGYNVNIRDPSADQRNAALQYVKENAPPRAAQIGSKKLGHVQVFEDLASTVKDAWLTIEAVPEVLQLKIDTFGELDSLVPDDCLLASNSSSYKSNVMLSKVRPGTHGRVLNMHYFMPPDLRVVELMTSGSTEPEIFPFLMDVLKGLEMFPVTVRKESTGFLFNRIWAAIKRECLLVLADGVGTPEDIDAIWHEMWDNSKVGPCGFMDQVGLDTVAFIEGHYIDERHLDSRARDFVRSEYVEKGKLGNKSNLGGLYPPKSVANRQANGDTNGHGTGHNTVPTLYFLDIGVGNLDAPFSSGRVLSGAADGRPLKTLVHSEAAPDGVDVCRDTGRLYWTNMGVPRSNDGCVKSCALDGSDVRTIIPVGAVHTPKEIVVANVSKKVYFSDREGLRVMRCNLDGSKHETLIQTGDWQDPSQMADPTRWCVGITVDEKRRKFYWTQKGPSKAGKGRIFRANIDIPAGQSATDRTDIEVLFSHLPEPIDLEFDKAAEMLYWTDRGEMPYGNSLNRAYVGSSKPAATTKFEKTYGYTILATGLHEAIGLKLDTVNKHIYASDLGGCIYQFDLDGSNRVKMYEGQGAYTGLTFA